MQDVVISITKILSTAKLSLHDEMTLQREMLKLLTPLNPIQSYRLDDKNIIDFYINGIGIEVKIKGSKSAIFRQCERYCKFDEIKVLVLVTNRSMGFPKDINQKHTYVINIGKAWL